MQNNMQQPLKTLKQIQQFKKKQKNLKYMKKPLKQQKKNLFSVITAALKLLVHKNTAVVVV